MDIPVLKYVDVLIGLSFVMVLLSTIVLAVTQVLLASAFARSRHLKRGLERLVRQLEPESMGPHSEYLARLFLRHPLIGQWTILSYLRALRQHVQLARATSRQKKDVAASQAPLVANAGHATVVQNVQHVLAEALLPDSAADAWILPPTSAGSVVEREELAYLMIELAAGEGPLMDPMDTGITPPSVSAAQTALARALRRSGIEDPAATLKAIRMKIVENERAQPDLPASRWRSNAVSDCAPGDFVGTLHATFDNTMARVTDAFAGETRIWVAAVSLVLAIGLQFDSFAFVKRLSINDKDRDMFVAEAQRLKDEAKGDAVTVAGLDDSIRILKSPSFDLLPVIVPPPAAATGLDVVDPYLPDLDHVPGVLFTWVLLSLGAPFWFDMLKNLLKLRSVLAKQDDKDRESRQAATTTPNKGTASGPPPPDVGEAGDLTATGVIG